MDGATKLSLPPDSLQLLIAAVLNPPPQVESSSEISTVRSLNTVYRLDCTAPYGSLIVKLPPPIEVRVLRSERDIFRVESLVTTLLASKNLIAEPKPFIFDDSQSVIDTAFLVKPFLSGKPLSEEQQADAALGHYLAKINSVTSPNGKFGCFENPRFFTYKEYFLWLMEGVLLDGEELLVLLPYEQIREEVKRWAWTLDDVKEARLVVLDLRRDEFIEGEDGSVKGLAGAWERSVWGAKELQSCFDNDTVKASYNSTVSSPEKDNGARVSLHELLTCSMRIIQTFYRQSSMSEEELSERRRLVRTLNALSNPSRT